MTFLAGVRSALLMIAIVLYYYYMVVAMDDVCERFV